VHTDIIIIIYHQHYNYDYYKHYYYVNSHGLLCINYASTSVF